MLKLESNTDAISIKFVLKPKNLIIFLSAQVCYSNSGKESKTKLKKKAKTKTKNQR